MKLAYKLSGTNSKELKAKSTGIFSVIHNGVVVLETTNSDKAINKYFEINL